MEEQLQCPNVRTSRKGVTDIAYNLGAHYSDRLKSYLNKFKPINLRNLFET
jgi:hypothetical protein